SAPRARSLRSSAGSVPLRLACLADSVTCCRASSWKQLAVFQRPQIQSLYRTRKRPERQKAKAVTRMSVILVVDDDSATRLLVRSILEIAGHEVIEAPHGSAALDLISAQRLPDVVVTDLTMPVLDGKELIAQLRSGPVTATIPIVVVSGNLAEARTLKANGLVEAVISKPFVSANLAHCIQAVASEQSRPPRVAEPDAGERLKNGLRRSDLQARPA